MQDFHFLDLDPFHHLSVNMSGYSLVSPESHQSEQYLKEWEDERERRERLGAEPMRKERQKEAHPLSVGTLFRISFVGSCMQCMKTRILSPENG